MNFLTNFHLKISTVLKITGLAILAIIVIALFFRLIGASIYTFFPNSSISKKISVSDSMSGPGGGLSEMAMWGNTEPIGLSARNVVPVNPPVPTNPGSVSTGDTAEAFEVTEYNAKIETRKLDEICASIANLKARTDVIFENSSEYDKGCNFVFKVKHKSANEILDFIKKLNPKDLNENIYTIKGLVDDFTSEIEILEKKLFSIDETLKKAVSAYDDVTALATRVKDVESLAKIIDSKINVIERLTQERININSQLESIQRSKSEQLDRIEYTYFRINVYEDKFIDGKGLIDSWKNEIKQFITDINKVAQDVTVNLITVLLKILLFVIYLFVLLVVVKYGWGLAKYIWKK